MNTNGNKLRISRIVNKVGDIMYDYGNSAWIASLGAIGQRFLGVYKIAELMVTIVIGPFAGVLADRFDRKKILQLTDFISFIMCVLVALIGHQTVMLYGLIVVNVVLALTGVFSTPAYKAYIGDVVGKEQVVTYNASVVTAVQIIKVASPMIGFVVLEHLGLRMTLLIEALSFLISLICVSWIREDSKVTVAKVKTSKRVLKDMWDGVVYIFHHQDIFFLLIIASVTNFFVNMFEYLLPFTNRLLGSDSAYATFLSFSAVAVLTGSVLARFIKNTLPNLLIMLALSGLGIVLIAPPSLLGLPIWLSYGGQIVYKIFEATFNIHFFSQVQLRGNKAYMGRVFSSIYTLALVLAPFGPLLMTLFP